ncbi:MAG: hypothetical protein ACE5JK_08240, partial [Candidatus Omnitrophota bacterium]
KEAEKARREKEKLERQIRSITWAVKRYGEITEDTAKKILEAEKRFGREAAIAKYFGEIIKDVGVNQRNLNALWTGAGKILEEFENNSLHAVDATEALDKSFKLLLEGAQDLGEEGSVAMTKFILKVRESGLEVRTVAEYTTSQLQRIPKALTDLVAGVPDYKNKIASLTSEIDKLKGELKDIEEGTSAYGDKTKEIMALQRELVETTYRSEHAYYRAGEEVRNLGKIALHTFNSLISSGISWTDTVDQMKKPLGALRDKYKELGIGATAPIKRLFDIVGVTEKHKELFTSIEANKEIMEALGNSGWMTADVMETLTEQATTYHKRLKDAGIKSEDALRAIAPTLQKIYDYAEAYGFKIDETTQGLIDEAVAIGRVKKAEEDRIQKLSDLFGRFADRMGKIFDRLGNRLEGALGTVSVNAPIAGGFQKGGTFTVPQPAMIKVHPREIIDITPFSKIRTAKKEQKTGPTITIAPVYAPKVFSIDSQDTYRFMTTKGRDAFEKMIQANVRGITKRIKEETEKM